MYEYINDRPTDWCGYGLYYTSAVYGDICFENGSYNNQLKTRLEEKEETDAKL